LQSFGGDEEFLYVLSGPLLVYHVDLLHDAWVEDAEVAADVLLADLGVRANDVVVADDSVFDLGPSLYEVAVADLSVEDVALDAENVIAAYLHDIVFL